LKFSQFRCSFVLNDLCTSNPNAAFRAAFLFGGRVSGTTEKTRISPSLVRAALVTSRKVASDSIFKQQNKSRYEFAVTLKSLQKIVSSSDGIARRHFSVTERLSHVAASLLLNVAAPTGQH
jgi:hypothetical protein